MVLNHIHQLTFCDTNVQRSLITLGGLVIASFYVGGQIQQWGRLSADYDYTNLLEFPSLVLPVVGGA